MRTLSLGALLLAMLAAPAALAQSGPNVTLQLPSFRSTGVHTSVIVPDSGTAPLASQRQSFYARSMVGPRRQSAIGTSQAAAGTQMNVQVHDPRAAEAELLRSARERRATWQRGSLTGRTVTVEPAAALPLVSIAEIRRRQASAATAQAGESARLLAEARRARAEGKAVAARVYYQMATRGADAAQRAAIAAEARQLD